MNSGALSSPSAVPGGSWPAAVMTTGTGGASGTPSLWPPLVYSMCTYSICRQGAGDSRGRGGSKVSNTSEDHMRGLRSGGHGGGGGRLRQPLSLPGLCMSHTHTHCFWVVTSVLFRTGCVSGAQALTSPLLGSAEFVTSDPHPRPPPSETPYLLPLTTPPSPSPP